MLPSNSLFRRRRRHWEREYPYPHFFLLLTYLHCPRTRAYTLSPALLLLCLLLAHGLPCAADGIFIPPVAVEHLPDIPRQQAFISYFNGEQELIIQSDFQGEGSDFAWIIPTPAEPVHIERADPELFHHLRYAMRPITIYGPTWRLVLGAFLLVWAVFHLAIGPHGRSTDAPLRGILFAAAFLVAPLLTTAFLIPNTMGSSSDPIAVEPGVTVLQSTIIGNYDIRVLDAKTPAALRQWLTDNGFNTLPPRGDQIVQDYIDQGWTFTAAKLRRGSESTPAVLSHAPTAGVVAPAPNPPSKGVPAASRVGDVAPGAKPDSNAMPQQSSVPRTAPDYARPHPIALRFPTDTPIYPMRLTQLAGGNLHLDLYLLAEQRAKVPGMQTKFCQQFTSEEGLKSLPIPSNTPRSQSPFEGGAGVFGGGGCSSRIATHLTATLDNTQLDHDYPIHFRPYAPTQSKVWLPRGFRWTLVERGLLAFALPLLLGALWRYWLREKAEARRGLWVFLLAGVALAAAIAYWTYSACPMGVELLYDSESEIFCGRLS